MGIHGHADTHRHSTRSINYANTKVNDLDRLVEFVVDGEVLLGSLGAVVLDVRKASSSQDVIVAGADRPIEVGHAALIVNNVGVLDEVRCPRWLLALQQVPR